MRQATRMMGFIVMMVTLSTLGYTFPATAAVSAQHTVIDLPPDALLAITQAMRAEFPAAYQIQPTSNGYQAMNQEQRLRVIFTPDGVQISRTMSADAWGLSLTGIGYATLHPVPAATLITSDNRLEYRRSEVLTEWYVNTPFGLEQGFTLSVPPAGRQAGTPLQLALSVSGGLRPQVINAQTLALVDAEGQTVFRYTGLMAEDAAGQRLPAALDVQNERTLLRVDDRHAHYPISIDPWVQQVRLEPTDGIPYSVFGFSVAVDGNTILIGSNKAAYVFVWNGSAWIQQARFTGSGDGFGRPVALEGDTALVCATGLSQTQGVVYVFVRDGTTWSQQVILTPSEADFDFGGMVSLSGDTALIGNYHDNYASSPTTPGSAYIFVRNGITWTQQAKLTPGDGTVGDNFGTGVALDGDAVLIGAPYATINSNQSQGTAYVFVRNGSSWTQQAKLIADDGAAGDSFGYVVALDGDTALLSALFADVNGNVNQGTVYVFVRNETDWTQQAKLVADDGRANQWFGRGVALDGDVALVGLRAGYLFRRNGTNWLQEQKLVPSDNLPLDWLGWSVALDGDLALVGEPSLNLHPEYPDYHGAAYVFQFSTTMPSSYLLWTK